MDIAVKNVTSILVKIHQIKYGIPRHKRVIVYLNGKVMIVMKQLVMIINYGMKLNKNVYVNPLLMVFNITVNNVMYGTVV